MNRDDIIDLLTVIQAVTNRTVGEADVNLWYDFIGDLDREAAMRAVRDHFRERTGVWLEPGFVSQRVRDAHRARVEQEHTAREREAIDAKVAAIAAEVAAKKAIPDANPDQEHRRPERSPHDPKRVPCPYPSCRAEVGRPCVADSTGQPMRHAPGFHPSRIADAQAQAAGHPATPSPEPHTAAVMPDPGPLVDPCQRCHRWIRLGPEAHKSENPCWCGECNFAQHEFMRLRSQDEALGQSLRTKVE
jgi:hypothetical protein